MYKKRFKKWNVRKRIYRKTSDGSGNPTPTPSGAASPEGAGAGMQTLSSDSDGDVYGYGYDDGYGYGYSCGHGHGHGCSDGYSASDGDGDAEEVTRACLVSMARTCKTAGPDAGLELVLDSVLAWSLCKLEAHGCGGPDPMLRYLANPNQPPMQDSRTMYRTFELVFDLWQHGQGQLAGMAARRGFYALEFVLGEDNPDLVWHMLDTVYDMIARGHTRLLAMFLPHAAALARRRLPANHPLHRILGLLATCDFETEQGTQRICHMLRQAWLRNVELLSRHVGRPEPERLWLYEQLIWDGRTRMRRDCGLAQRRDMMLAGLGEMQRQGDESAAARAGGAGSCSCPGADGLDGLRIRALMLEYTQMDLGEKQAAEGLALDLLQRTASDTGSRSNARFHAYARKMLARVQQDKQDWATAEENLRWAVTKREAAHGADSNLRVVREMWVLAAHFERAGMADAAGQTTREAISRAARYLGEGGGEGSGRCAG